MKRTTLAGNAAIALIALIALIATTFPASCQGVKTTDQGAAFLDLIEGRTAARKFTADPVPKADLERILRAALTAPSAMDRRPFRFLVVQDKAKILELKQACVDFGLPVDFDAYFSAPAYIVALVDMDADMSEYSSMDGNLAAGYVLLAARALGYGTCYITDVIPDAVTQRVLGIPDRYSRASVIPIGKPVAEIPDALSGATKKPASTEGMVYYEVIQ